MQLGRNSDGDTRDGEVVIDFPRLGTLNIHASLLPQYRGAAPIQAAVRDGCTETGVTIMRMVEALDAGPVILALATPIAADETGGELQLRLAELGAAAIIEALALIALGEVVETPQDYARATYAKKTERDDARLHFAQPAAVLARVARAYDPKPGAWCVLRGGEVRLFGVTEVEGVGAPGTVLAADANGIVVACGVGAVRCAEVHTSGKRRQLIAEWVRGRGVAVGDTFA